MVRSVDVSLLRLMFFVKIIISVFCVFSQQNHSLRLGTITPKEMSFQIDSLSIVPHSFMLYNIPTESYALDPWTARLYLKDSSLLEKNISYRYEVYAQNFSIPYKHKSLSLIESQEVKRTPVISYYSSSNNFYDEEYSIATNGSISRGVSIGNNQDLVLSSALNLQIVGNLSKDIQIVASISDKNIPIQPEGNTTLISNINNIFFTLLFKQNVKLNMGDVEIKSPKSSKFMVYSRNLLGAEAQVYCNSWKRLKMTNSLGGGVAKGKYVRQKLPLQNGVQGPYKLYGSSNEVGIVIIAGSERVYLDGELLTRGQERDYVIDYNMAEITFTPLQMIAEEKRVYVEFEYRDRQFARYNLFSHNDFVLGEEGKLRFHVNYYQEQDLKNQSLQPELNRDQKLFLSSLGDNLQEAYYEYADSAAFSSDRVLYCRKDTIVNGVEYPSIYEYSTDQGQQLYSVGFTYMGPNKGSYVMLSSTSNGRVFGWVAPENGMLKGDYNPVLLLGTPKLSQMATLRAEYYFQPTTFLQTELALSNYDQNLFSSSDDRDNVGFSYSLLWQSEHPIKIKKNPQSLWQWKTALDWQYVHKNFHTIESFRAVEFARDYGLTDAYSMDFSEQMLHASVGLSKASVSTTLYDINWFSRLGNVSSIRQSITTKNSIKLWQIDANASLLLSDDSLQNSRFWTANLLLTRKGKSVEVGLVEKMENNRTMDAIKDTIRGNSFAFNEIQFFLKNREASKYKYNIQYKNRMEYLWRGGKLGANMEIHEASAQFAFDRLKNQHLSSKAIYRGQRVYSKKNAQAWEHYFIGNVEYNARFLKNVLVLNTFYEAGSGMEQKKSFSYLKVATGQGTHVWNDYNSNGLEELDEFEIASYQDEANYIKIWLSNVDYVNTYNALFTQNVQIKPSAVWGGKQGWKRFVARFSDVATLRTSLKKEKLNFSPFSVNMEDTSVIANMLNVNNTFSFNNNSSKIAFDGIVQITQNKALLYYGYEMNKTSFQKMVVKSRPCNILQWRAEYEHGVTSSQSEYLSNRSYEIEKQGVATGFILQYQTKCRGEVAYSFEKNENRAGGERMVAHHVSATMEYRIVKRGIVNISAEYVHLKGLMQENSVVAYQLLKGLSLGNNALWHLNYQFSITEFLQLSVQYDGRFSSGHKIVHTGNVIIKAQF